MFTPNAYGMFSMPTLETKRLILRRINIHDAKDIFAYSRDEEVARHVLWSAQKDLSEAKDYCRFMMKRYRCDQPSSWGIIEKATNRLVGTIGYMDYNQDNATVEVGYSLARWLWNGGYMTEALTAVIHYLLEDVEMNRVEAYHDPRNPHSGSVMKKCGMTYEGTLRQSDRNNQGICDASWYAILAE